MGGKKPGPISSEAAETTCVAYRDPLLRRKRQSARKRGKTEAVHPSLCLFCAGSKEPHPAFSVPCAFAPFRQAAASASRIIPPLFPGGAGERIKCVWDSVFIYVREKLVRGGGRVFFLSLLLSLVRLQRGSGRAAAPPPPPPPPPPPFRCCCCSVSHRHISSPSENPKLLVRPPSSRRRQCPF